MQGRLFKFSIRPNYARPGFKQASRGAVIQSFECRQKQKDAGFELDAALSVSVNRHPSPSRSSEAPSRSDACLGQLLEDTRHDL